MFETRKDLFIYSNRFSFKNHAHLLLQVVITNIVAAIICYSNYYRITLSDCDGRCKKMAVYLYALSGGGSDQKKITYCRLEINRPEKFRNYRSYKHSYAISKISKVTCECSFGGYYICIYILNNLDIYYFIKFLRFLRKLGYTLNIVNFLH